MSIRNILTGLIASATLAGLVFSGGVTAGHPTRDILIACPTHHLIGFNVHSARHGGGEIRRRLALR